MQNEIKRISDSEIHSLGDYLVYAKNIFSNFIWFSTRINPFDFNKNSFQWISIPFELDPGQYRLCFTVNLGTKWYPIIAYGLIYPDSVKSFPHPYIYPVGIGLSFTPICVTSSAFSFSRNTSDFIIRNGGTHKICITTSNWTDLVNQTTCEILLLNK